MRFALSHVRRLSALLLIGVLVSAMAIVGTPARTAYAWPDNIDPAGECFELAALSFVNPFSASNDNVISFNQWMSQAITGITQSPNANYDYDYTDPDSSYILIGNNLSSYSLIWESVTGENIKFDKNGQNRQLTFPAGSNKVTNVNRNIVPTDPFFDEYPLTWDLSNPVTVQAQTTITDIDDVQCVHKANNIEYGVSYDGKADYTDFDDDVLVAGGCDLFDIACQISNIFNGISNTFTSVGEAIVNGIGQLFIPSQDKISEAFTRMGAALTNTLGFVIFPITWIVTTASALISQGATTGGIDFGEFFGANFVVDFQAPLNNLGWMNSLFNLAKAGIVLQLMFGLWHKYMEIVRA